MRPTYGGIELKVVDDDGGDLPAGEAGELFIRSALAIDGYHGAEAQMAELPGDWKSVGDIGGSTARATSTSATARPTWSSRGA